MATLSDFIDAFFNLNEIKSYFRLLAEIFPAPTERTMHIVENGHSVNPFRFMAFGYSVFALIAISQPLLEGRFSFADSIVRTILVLISYLVFAAVQYKILKDVSHNTRTFDNYMVMSAITGGMLYFFIGAALLVILFSEILGIILIVSAAIYMIPYGIRTSKLFWQISYGKIIFYSFLSSLVASITVFIIGFLLVIVLGLGVFFQS